MGRDYVIRRYLRIDHESGTAFYELEPKYGYYYHIECLSQEDSDVDEEDSYHKVLNHQLYQYITDICLTPRNDLVIYENGKFRNENWRAKYLQLIHNKINKNYLVDTVCKQDIGETLKDWEKVTKITKSEFRHEMGEKGLELYSSKG